MSLVMGRGQASHYDAHVVSKDSESSRRRKRQLVVLAAVSLAALAAFVGLRPSATVEQEVESTVNSALKLKDFIDSFPEAVTIHVNCSGTSLFVANHMEPDVCLEEPHITFENMDGKPGMKKGSLYTMAVVDPDWPVPDDPSTTDFAENRQTQRLLWLITNIPGVSMNLKDGEEIHEWEGPNKPNKDGTGVLCDKKHDGEHRIAILLFKQMPPFEVIDYLTAPRFHFKVQDMLVKRVHQMPIGDFFWYTKCGGYKGVGGLNGPLKPI